MAKTKNENKFSWTQINTSDRCSMIYFIQYMLRKETVTDSKFYMDRGTIGHFGVETLYNTPCATDFELIEAMTEEFDRIVEERKDMMLEEVQALRSETPFLLTLINSYREQFKNEFVFIMPELPFDVKVARGINLKGSIDGIGVDKDGGCWVLEHKFTKTPVTEEQLMVNGQAALYYFIAKDIFKLPIKGIKYNQFVTKPFNKPTQNKDGKMSRASIYTTWEIYRSALIEVGLDPVDYMGMEAKLSAVNPIKRVEFKKTNLEVHNYMKDIMNRIRILKYRKRYHVWNRCDDKIKCTTCSHKELCLEFLKGGDTKWILDNYYKEKGTKKFTTKETQDKLTKIKEVLKQWD